MAEHPDFGRPVTPPNGEQNPYAAPSHYGSPSPQGQPNSYGYADPGYSSQQQPPTYGQPYGQPQPMYGVAPYPQAPYSRPEHPQSQMVFIMGILGIFTGVTAFIAWYMGGQAKKEIAAGAPYEWGGQLKTGYILGKIFAIISIVSIGLIIAVYVLMFMSIFLIGSSY